MTRVRRFTLAAILLLLAAAPARADLTAFIGADTTPANRQVSGAAIGFGLLIIGVEIEYAYTTDDVTAGAPSLKTGMGNVLLQTPIVVLRHSAVLHDRPAESIARSSAHTRTRASASTPAAA